MWRGVRERENPLCEVRRQGEPNMKVVRPGITRLLGAVFTDCGGGGAQGVMMTSPMAGGRAGLASAPIAHSSAHAPKASTRRRRAGDALIGHEHGGACVLVSDVLHERSPKPAQERTDSHNKTVQKSENEDCDTHQVQAGQWTNQRRERNPDAGPVSHNSLFPKVSGLLGGLRDLLWLLLKLSR